MTILDADCNGLGVLSETLRNYVMSHTSAVFAESYQAIEIRTNLLKTRFEHLYPGEGVWGDDSLDQLMRSMSLQRDANAPIGPTQGDLENFELRHDVSKLRESVRETQTKGTRREQARARSQLKALLSNLARLALNQNRREYFRRVDHLRALGESTSREASALAAADMPSPRNGYVRRLRGGEALDGVARFIQSHILSGEQGGTVKPYNLQKHLELLVGYLRDRPPDFDYHKKKRNRQLLNILWLGS